LKTLYKISAVDQFKIKNAIFRRKSDIPLILENYALSEPYEKI